MAISPNNDGSAHEETETDDARVAVLAQILDLDVIPLKETFDLSQKMAQALSALTFLEITPPLMRGYVPQEISELGETGENLSAVLYQLCKDPERKQGLVDWLAELSPMARCASWARSLPCVRRPRAL